MRFRLLTLGMLMSMVSSVGAATKVEERLEECAEVLGQILKIPEGIPRSLLDKAECAVVIPSVKKVAIGFGGSYGRGAMVCRTGADYDGPWGSPAMYRLEGGSVGFQLGGSATDFVLLVMNPKGVKALLGSKAKLGADASAVAGPKGRTAEAATDLQLTAEILTWSRAKGLFAGVSLKGSTLRQDNGANQNLYGKKVSARQILLDGAVQTPAAGEALVELLQEKSPANRSN